MKFSRESIRFRPEAEEDVPFLLALYGTTRADELARLPWNDDEKIAFVHMQFHAQRTHYRKHYTDAQFLVIEKDGLPIGRLYRRVEDGDLRIIDITLAPDFRGSGIGTVLLRELMDEAASRDEKLSIHVENFNPALRLYERLGFRKVSEYGVYYLMEWRAA